MAETIVDSLYHSNRDVIAFLDASGEISLRSSVDESFRKILLLAAASYFEHIVKQVLLDFVSERSGADEAILTLVKSRAVERQYHTYFNWESKNANSFFALFGEKFSAHMRNVVEGDADLKESIRAFLELGDLRNKMVHLNFASFPMEKTVDEIYEMYGIASRFVECLPERLRDPL